MKDLIPDSEIERLIGASYGSKFRNTVSYYVSKYFRSDHYLSSRLIVDSIILNLFFNEEITPTSADRIITAVRRNNRTFYSIVERAFPLVEDAFDEYAATVIGGDVTSLKNSTRTVNYIVYILSYDIAKTCRPDRDELRIRAYTYEELPNT